MGAEVIILANPYTYNFLKGFKLSHDFQMLMIITMILMIMIMMMFWSASKFDTLDSGNDAALD